MDRQSFQKAVSASVLCATLLASVDAALARPPDGWPAQVEAVYRVTFTGFNIGDFRFNSKVQENTYKLDGSTKLSALLGAFKYRGTIRTTGTVDSSGPHPADHNFEYKSSSKRSSLKMTFGPGGVTSIDAKPKRKPAETAVPVEPHHLTNVLDPLSAIMALSRAGKGNPCDRTVSVFDGKHRLDVVLSPKGETDIKETMPSGQPSKGYVCRVKYVPIAGHKQNENTKALAEGDIEIVLRPIPAANLVVPHRITMSTGWGPVALTAASVDITTRDEKQIALR